MSYDDDFIAADEAYERGDFPEALRLFKVCADGGGASAMERIAGMYTCGEGVSCDYDKALEWEEKAIDSGGVSALLNAGITCRIKGDIRKARYWFEKSLDAGDSEAALQLAKLYMVSDKEKDKVIEYLNMVANDPRTIEVSRIEAAELLENYK